MTRKKTNNDIHKLKENLKDELYNYFYDLRDHISNLERKAEKKIRNNPIKSTLISFGAGILTGAALSTLKNRRRK